MVLDGLGKSLDGIIRKIRRLPEINKEAVTSLLKEIQRSLIMADVNVEICLKVTENIKKQAMDENINIKVNRKDFIIKILHDELIKFLGGHSAPKRIKTNKETIILLVGIQGSGKTTTVGKLAHYYNKKGFKVGAICTDTDRPGAYDQMTQTMDSIGVAHFGNPKEKNSLKLARKGLKHFFKSGKNKKDLIIVDTAGRHKEESELMKEMEKLENVIKPNETILVIDGTLGQQAYAQAKSFSETTHVGSIIITKLDGSAKGGGALSAAAAANAPIKFIGMGEKVEDLDEFNPTSFIGTLMGVPDLKGLLEKIEELGIEPDEDAAKRMQKGKFTLTDMYIQMKSLRKLGGLGKILGMMGQGNLPKEAKEMAQGNMDKIEVMMKSMTSHERDNPDVIRKTRITRIARGSGTTYTDVKGLLKQWSQMNTMMKNMLGKKQRKKHGAQPGMGEMPGMDGLPGGMDLTQMQQMMGGKKKRKKHPW